MKSKSELVELLSKLSDNASSICCGNPSGAVDLQKAIEALTGQLKAVESTAKINQIIQTFEDSSRPTGYDDIFYKGYTGKKDFAFKGKDTVAAAIFDDLVEHMSDSNLIMLCQSDYADYLGITRQHLQPHLKDLERRGYICIYPNSDVQLLRSKNDGQIYMINPFIACKRSERSKIFKVWKAVCGKPTPSTERDARWTSITTRSGYYKTTKVSQLYIKSEERKEVSSTVPSTTVEPTSLKDNGSNSSIDTYTISQKADPMQALAPDFIPDLNENPFSFTGEV